MSERKRCSGVILAHRDRLSHTLMLIGRGRPYKQTDDSFQDVRHINRGYSFNKHELLCYVPTLLVTHLDA
jgi:hypothetical protein